MNDDRGQMQPTASAPLLEAVKQEIASSRSVPRVGNRAERDALADRATRPPPARRTRLRRGASQCLGVSRSTLYRHVVQVEGT